MFQQIIALIVIVFFLIKLFRQRSQKKINASEFIFWFFFWSTAGIAIILLKWIDEAVAFFGFSAKGIDVLLYISVVVLFYFIFRLRLKIEKLDRDLTKMTRAISLKNND